MFYKRIVASGDLVMPAGTVINAVRLESTSDTCSAIIFDDITQALGATNSHQVLTMLATVGSGGAHPISSEQNFPIGITTERGISITLAGTTPKLYIYYS